MTSQNGSSQKPVVLVVDEDRDFLADCVMPLIQAGYEVLTAVDSQEAQYLCELYPRPIHLMILDIPLEPHLRIEDMAPRQYGTKLVAMMRVKRPSSRILITSATPAWKVSRQRLGASLWQFPLLQRPCTGHDLLTKIQSILPTDPQSPSPPSIPISQCA